MMTFQIK